MPEKLTVTHQETIIEATDEDKQITVNERVEVTSVEKDSKPPAPTEIQNKKDCDKPSCGQSQTCNTGCNTGAGLGFGWGWLGALLLWFIIFTVLFWLIYYSLKPTFVLSNDTDQVDTAKVLLAAVISSLILVAIIWLIKLAVTRK
jgi:hypothetical protein